MFSFAKLVALVAAAATANIAVASPAATVTVVNASDIIVGGTAPKRSTNQALLGTVFFCTDANFSGNCFNFVDIPDNFLCFEVPFGFDDNISSFGPDSDLSCVLFADHGCGGRTLGPLRFPGITNLDDSGFNDVMSSFTCNFV